MLGYQNKVVSGDQQGHFVVQFKGVLAACFSVCWNSSWKKSGRISQELCLKSQERRVCRGPTLRARQRDGPVCLNCKAALNLLEHMRKEDVLNRLPSPQVNGKAFLQFHQLQCREVCDPAGIIRLLSHLIEQALIAAAICITGPDVLQLLLCPNPIH